MKKQIVVSSVLSAVLALGLGGCGESSDGKGAVAVQQAADYATVSDANYSVNTHGLVSAETVAAWVTDWANTKPEGMGKLFVMQMGAIPDSVAAGKPYIKANGTDVFVYDRSSGCTTPSNSRTDGISNVPKPVFTGEEMDMAFHMYGIDARKDMFLLLLAQEDASDYIAGAARMWYTLTYWGVPQENIAFLNGQASYVLNPNNADSPINGQYTADQLFAAAQSPENNTTYMSIKDIRTDGTVLQATMGDMMDVVESGRQGANDFVILDARSEAEYLGTKAAKTEDKICGALGGEQCYSAFDGHIEGAQWLFFTEALHTDDNTTDINGDGLINGFDASYTFRDMAEIEALFAARGYRDGKTVYTYCRTGTKASLLTFTSAAVMGYPTRMYDGSWIQWGKMTDRYDVNGDQMLPSTSAWRTDDYTEALNYDAKVEDYWTNPINGLHLDGTDTNAMIEEDKAYKN